MAKFGEIGMKPSFDSNIGLDPAGFDIGMSSGVGGWETFGKDASYSFTDIGVGVLTGNLSWSVDLSAPKYAADPNYVGNGQPQILIMDGNAMFPIFSDNETIQKVSDNTGTIPWYYDFSSFSDFPVSPNGYVPLPYVVCVDDSFLYVFGYYERLFIGSLPQLSYLCDLCVSKWNKDSGARIWVSYYEQIPEWAKVTEDPSPFANLYAADLATSTYKAGTNKGALTGTTFPLNNWWGARLRLPKVFPTGDNIAVFHPGPFLLRARKAQTAAVLLTRGDVVTGDVYTSIKRPFGVGGANNSTLVTGTQLTLLNKSTGNVYGKLGLLSSSCTKSENISLTLTPSIFTDAAGALGQATTEIYASAGVDFAHPVQVIYSACNQKYFVICFQVTLRFSDPGSFTGNAVVLQTYDITTLTSVCNEYWWIDGIEQGSNGVCYKTINAPLRYEVYKMLNVYQGHWCPVIVDNILYDVLIPPDTLNKIVVEIRNVVTGAVTYYTSTDLSIGVNFVSPFIISATKDYVIIGAWDASADNMHFWKIFVIGQKAWYHKEVNGRGTNLGTLTWQAYWEIIGDVTVVANGSIFCITNGTELFVFSVNTGERLLYKDPIVSAGLADILALTEQKLFLSRSNFETAVLT